jgi:hypothetical protein
MCTPVARIGPIAIRALRRVDGEGVQALIGHTCRAKMSRDGEI